MTVISAAQVKELRERTGAGMMECKNALMRSNGSLDGAIEELRKMGAMKSQGKAGRITAEGEVKIIEDDIAAMVEVNSETDFVSRDANFSHFVEALAKTITKNKPQDVEQLAKLPLEGSRETVEEARNHLVAKVGENIQIRRFVISNPGALGLGTYVHGKRIGVIVELDVDNKELARDIAMHIAASKPLVINPTDIDEATIAKEKEIYTAQAANSGKPPEIIEKMVMGRLKKYLDEISLVGQPFVRDPDTSVMNLLNKHRAKVLKFYRFEVGEGVEKTTKDFKEEVMSQVKSG